MRWDSFRVRLSLWNVAVLALVLGGFGLALCLSIEVGVERAIDRELAARARRFALGTPPPPPFPPRFRRPHPMDSPPLSEGEPLPGIPGGPFPGPPPGEDLWAYDRESARAAFFSRPRFFDENGRGMGLPEAREPGPQRGLQLCGLAGEGGPLAMQRLAVLVAGREGEPRLDFGQRTREVLEPRRLLARHSPGRERIGRGQAVEQAARLGALDDHERVGNGPTKSKAASMESVM